MIVLLQAFSSLPSDLVEQLTQDPDTAQLIIQHHIIRGEMTFCTVIALMCTVLQTRNNSSGALCVNTPTTFYLIILIDAHSRQQTPNHPVKAKFHDTIQLTSRSQTCSRAGSRAGSRALFALVNSITLSRSQTWSQTWFPTCRRQVRAILTCRDSSNLVADRFRPYSITLFCSLAGLRRAGRRPARDLVASWVV